MGSRRVLQEIWRICEKKNSIATKNECRKWKTTWCRKGFNGIGRIRGKFLLI